MLCSDLCKFYRQTGIFPLRVAEGFPKSRGGEVHLLPSRQGDVDVLQIRQAIHQGVQIMPVPIGEIQRIRDAGVELFFIGATAAINGDVHLIVLRTVS